MPLPNRVPPKSQTYKGRKRIFLPVGVILKPFFGAAAATTSPDARMQRGRKEIFERKLLG
jgi:hypothetical protein